MNTIGIEYKVIKIIPPAGYATLFFHPISAYNPYGVIAKKSLKIFWRFLRMAWWEYFFLEFEKFQTKMFPPRPLSLPRQNSRIHLGYSHMTKQGASQEIIKGSAENLELP